MSADNGKRTVLVIGGGIAGATAALAALAKGLSVTIVSRAPGATALSGGSMLDFRGAPMRNHPLRRLGLSDETALDLFGKYGEQLLFHRLNQAGLKYKFAAREPFLLPGVTGLRPCLAVPKSHAAGDFRALTGKRVAVVNIKGLTDAPRLFIPHYVQGEGPTSLWQDLTDAIREVETVDFEIAVSDLCDKDAAGPFELAATLDTGTGRALLAEQLKRTIGDANFDALALPPVLGIENWFETIKAVGSATGTRVFEWVAGGESLPGLRLERALARAVADAGIETIRGLAKNGIIKDHRLVKIELDQSGETRALEPDAVVLAGGRFLSGGLIDPPFTQNSETFYREAVCGLPAYCRDRLQPAVELDRVTDDDYRARQPLFELGLRIDEKSRPFGADGKPAARNLFAAGSLLQCSGYGGLSTALFTGAAAGSRAAEDSDAV